MRRAIRIVAGLCAFVLGAAFAGALAVAAARVVPDARALSQARGPFPLVVLGLAMLCGGGLGAWWIAADPERRREAWAEQDQCLACGYFLTGNLSGVCPECGTDRTAAERAAR